MVTMRDVARLAGVSITTVSHVVNETRPVAADTRDRVLAAVEQTGYTGDAIARSLVTGGTRTIGLALPLAGNPHAAALTAAVEAAATEAGHTLILADTGEEGLRVAADHRPEAVIVDGFLPDIDGPTVIRRRGRGGSPEGFPRSSSSIEPRPSRPRVNGRGRVR